MISLIVPVYNTDPCMIRRSITSAIRQHVEHEILIVDDGSKADVAAYLDRLATEEDVRVFHKPNGGVSSARNFGIDRCSGEYVAFMDPDDELVDGYLSDALQALTKSHADVVFGGMSYVYPDGSHKDDCQSAIAAHGFQCITGDQVDYIKRSLFEKSALAEIGLTPLQYVSNCGALYRREAIGNTRFDESIVISEDRIFNFEVLSSTSKVALAGGIWYLYYQNADSASHQVRLHASTELVATARVYGQLCDKHGASEGVRCSVYQGILECYFQSIYYCIFDPNFKEDFGTTRLSYIRRLMGVPEYRQAFERATPTGTRWKILRWLGRNNLAVGVLMYCRAISILHNIKKNLTYRH